MSMESTGTTVIERIARGLHESIQRGPVEAQIAATLVQQMIDYGPDVLPRELYRDGREQEILAVACEDVEGAHRLAESMEPRHRVVELWTGWGFPGIVLAALAPDSVVEIVAAESRQLWLLRRVAAVLRVRNVRLQLSSFEDFARQRGASFDQVLLKRLPPALALERAAPLLAAGGKLWSWQKTDPGHGARPHRRDARGHPLRSEALLRLESPAAAGRVILRCAAASNGATAHVDPHGSPSETPQTSAAPPTPDPSPESGSA
jgi:predicted O-methyltransferase YrrM